MVCMSNLIPLFCMYALFTNVQNVMLVQLISVSNRDQTLTEKVGKLHKNQSP